MHSTDFCPAKSFLEEVAHDLHARYKNSVAQLTLILPSHRAAQSLVRTLASYHRQASWAPRTYTVPEWISQKAPWQCPSQLKLLSLLYREARQSGITTDSFEDFSLWGTQILSDFNKIDQYLVPAEKLFKQGKTGNHRSLLQEEKVSIDSLEERWYSLWRQLPDLYARYQRALLQAGLAYPGLQARKLYEAWEERSVSEQNSPIIAVGIEHLTPAEKRLFSWLEKEKVELLFYHDRPIETQSDSAVGSRPFLQRPAIKITPAATKRPILRLSACQNNIEQVEACRKELERLINERGSKALTGNMMIVLQDPSLLIALIHALPKRLGELHIHTGYPLTCTSSYTFLLLLLRFQLAYQEAKSVVTHPLTQALNALLAHGEPLHKRSTLIKKATQDPYTFIKQASAYLGARSYWVQPLAAENQLFSQIDQSLELLEKEVQTPSDGSSFSYSWEKIALQATRHLWDSIQAVWPSSSSPTLSQALLRLLHLEASRTTLPVQSSTSSEGIQLTALQNTRALEAKHLMILSMNEKGTASHLPSFLPIPLQEQYGFPSVAQEQKKERDTFYQLISRAETLFCTYTKAQGGEERSHYIPHMIYQEKWPTQEVTSCAKVIKSQPQKTSIQKDERVLKRLTQYCYQESHPHSRPERLLSPSAINSYLECPLRFYVQYVANIQSQLVLEEELSPPFFGQLLHRTMEALYRPYLQKEITNTLLQKLITKIEPTIQAQYRDLFNTAPEVRGNSLIAQKVLYKMVEHILHQDAEYTPFTLLHLELTCQKKPFPFQLSNGQKIGLGGIIDRVDQKGDYIRVIDYKTGRWTPMIHSLRELFEYGSSGHNKYALQLFWYAWLYKKQYSPGSLFKVTPTILSPRDQKVDTKRFILQKEKNKESVTDISPYILPFEEQLRTVLDEIFDPTLPFTAKEKKAPCPKNAPCYFLHI